MRSKGPWEYLVGWPAAAVPGSEMDPGIQQKCAQGDRSGSTQQTAVQAIRVFAAHLCRPPVVPMAGRLPALRAGAEEAVSHQGMVGASRGLRLPAVSPENVLLYCLHRCLRLLFLQVNAMHLGSEHRQQI